MVVSTPIAASTNGGGIGMKMVYPGAGGWTDEMAKGGRLWHHTDPTPPLTGH